MGLYGVLWGCRSNAPCKTYAEYLEQAKRDPGKMSNGLSGHGTSPHSAEEMLKFQAGIFTLHSPY